MKYTYACRTRLEDVKNKLAVLIGKDKTMFGMHSEEDPIGALPGWVPVGA